MNEAAGETTHTTMCPMNCHPTLCGMTVTVRDGAVVDVKGDKDNPDSAGFLCVRGQAAREIIGNPKRILRPLIRETLGEDFREASWDEALDLIAAHFSAVGPRATGVWAGHGMAANGYGVSAGGQLVARFAHLWGSQFWTGQMICWGMGAFGLGLTGALEVTTKEDMSAKSALVILWGANLASQPNTARHVAQAKKRGARIVAVDVRQSEACAQADEALIVRPGSDAALALALMHVIVAEGLHDEDFTAAHTLGFERLVPHLERFTPAWAEAETGIAAARIVALARAYATTRPAQIVIGGSSMHKGGNAWQAARAISCLPALTGQYGISGGGLGERHGAMAHGGGYASIAATDRRPPGDYIPNQMSAITAGLQDGRVKAMLLMGTNMLSSFADAAALEAAMAKLDLVVCYDLFLNETGRRAAHVVLPGTTWLEDIGAKSTHTHLYLTDKVLEPAGEARPVQEVLRGLAARLGVADYYPWADQEAVLNAVLDTPATGHTTVAALRAAGGRLKLKVNPVGHPTHEYRTPSGKLEFWSERAAAAGLPALPDYAAGETDGAVRAGAGAAGDSAADAMTYPLTLAHGRTLTHFHAFYDHGRALPKLAERDPGPELWLSPADAAARGLAHDQAIRVFNGRGAFPARAHVTDKVPVGTVWMRDGIEGLNRVTSGAPVLPEAALAMFGFSVGQAEFGARVEVAAA